MSQRTLIPTAVPEGTSCRIAGTLLDETRAALPGGSLTSLTLTLTDQETGAVIQGRSGQNVLGVNGGAVSAAGVLVLSLSALDNIMLGSAARERHVARLDFTYAAGTKNGWHEILFRVFR